jgi:LPS export ABC transporter protein LptC
MVSMMKLLNASALNFSLFVIIVSSSCTQHPAESVMVIEKDSLGVPSEVADTININYTENAQRVINLKAKLMQRYPTKEDNILFMKKGLEIYFYGDSGKLKSTIKSDWAKRFEKSRKTELHGNVVVTNDKGESMATDEIFWEQYQRKIYTSKFVTITTPTEILTGEGLEATDDFSTYEIKNPKGIIKRSDIK